jgi:hypothetical protein
MQRGLIAVLAVALLCFGTLIIPLRLFGSEHNLYRRDWNDSFCHGIRPSAVAILSRGI